MSVEFQYASDIDSPRASKGTDTRAQSSWLNKLGMSDGSTNQVCETHESIFSITRHAKTNVIISL